MSYLDHVRRCNRHDPSRFRRFRAGGQAVGWVRQELAQHLGGYHDLVLLTPEAVTLRPEAETYQARSAALATIAQRLVADGIIERLRKERYPLLSHWGAEPLAAIDRGVVGCFGIPAFGLHINGYVRRADGGRSLWIARRAWDRRVAPGKLDNMVGGGQPVGLTLAQNLLKEAHEEAGIGPELAARSQPVGAITYRMDSPHGLKDDTLFLYDLELDPAFVPRNTDGEVESFALMPAEAVAGLVRDQPDDFKFNVGLVLIDFLIRHGVLTPEEPDYLTLIRGLHG